MYGYLFMNFVVLFNFDAFWEIALWIDKKTDDGRLSHDINSDIVKEG